MFTYHCYTYMSYFYISVSRAIHVPYYRIPVIWLLPVIDMDIPVTGHVSCWYAICGTPHLLFSFPVILFPLYCSRFPLYCSCYIVPVSRYIVLCNQQSSGPVIMLPVSHIIMILVTLYIYISDHKVNSGMGETWRLIRSYRVMYWIHIVSPTAGGR